IGKLQAHELEMRKKSKMQKYKMPQDPTLYKGQDTSSAASNASSKIQTAFFSSEVKSGGKESNEGSSFSGGCENCNNHSQSSSSQNDQNQQQLPPPTSQQCYISINTSNLQNVTLPVAQEHMQVLSAIVTSYNALVARKIGNFSSGVN
ncbi:MAG: hypothetical protein Q8755_03465, partial [Candidatus Phytoplasma australasiaticum]|nr:hypothetical protein [Candidatus Phytoplasma australasiaticum]